MDIIRKDDDISASIAIAAIKYIRIYFNLKSFSSIFKTSDDSLKELSVKAAEQFEDFYPIFKYFYSQDAELEFNNIRNDVDSGKIDSINDAMNAVKELFNKHNIS